MIRRVFQTYAAAFAGLPRDTWILSLVLLINRSGSMVLPFIGLYLTQERGLSIAAAGQLLGLYGVGSTLGSYFGGWLSDRIGAVRTMHLSLWSAGVAFLALAVQRGSVGIAVGVLLLSTCAEAYRPAVMAEMGHRAPDAMRVRAFALLRLAANLGVGIGPVIGGMLALIDYGWLFVADAVTCWAASGILFLALAAPAAVTAEDERADARRRVGSPWTDGPFLGLMLVVFGMAIAFFQIMSTFPLYLREVYQLREDAIGLVLGFNAAIIVLFEMVLSHWAERRSRLLLIGIGGFLVCAGFALMPLGRSFLFALFTVSIWTIGEMLALPLANAVVAERPVRAGRGRYMGVYTTTYSLAFIVAPLAGTWAYDRLGPNVLWSAIGLLGIPILVGALLLSSAFGRPDRSP